MRGRAGGGQPTKWYPGLGLRRGGGGRKGNDSREPTGELAVYNGVDQSSNSATRADGVLFRVVLPSQYNGEDPPALAVVNDQMKDFDAAETTFSSGGFRFCPRSVLAMVASYTFCTLDDGAIVRVGEAVFHFIPYAYVPSRVNSCRMCCLLC